MNIYLVRHGETDWNIQSRIQGGIAVGLNERGIEQAREVTRHFPENFRCDLLVSPLRRARETAEILADQIDPRIFEELDFLRELDQGYWNGLQVHKVKNNLHPERYKSWLEEPIENKPPGGESLAEVKNRLVEGLRGVDEKYEGPLIIVAHKVVNSIIAHLAGEWPLEDVMNSLPGNAAVLEVELEPQEEERIKVEK